LRLVVASGHRRFKLAACNPTIYVVVYVVVVPGAVLANGTEILKLKKRLK
jgi:hypothetical protein